MLLRYFTVIEIDAKVIATLKKKNLTLLVGTYTSFRTILVRINNLVEKNSSSNYWLVLVTHLLEQFLFELTHLLGHF